MSMYASAHAGRGADTHTQTHTQDYKQSFVKSAKLLHWNGSLKPWKARSKWFMVWYRYYLPDPFSDWTVGTDAMDAVLWDLRDSNVCVCVFLCGYGGWG